MVLVKGTWQWALLKPLQNWRWRSRERPPGQDLAKGKALARLFFERKFVMTHDAYTLYLPASIHIIVNWMFFEESWAHWATSKTKLGSSLGTVGHFESRKQLHPSSQTAKHLEDIHGQHSCPLCNSCDLGSWRLCLHLSASHYHRTEVLNSFISLTNERNRTFGSRVGTFRGKARASSTRSSGWSQRSIFIDAGDESSWLTACFSASVCLIIITSDVLPQWFSVAESLRVQLIFYFLWAPTSSSTKWVRFIRFRALCHSSPLRLVALHCHCGVDLSFYNLFSPCQVCP